MNVASYDYVAMDRSGKRSRGQIEAPTRDQALRQVMESGLTPISIKAARQRGAKRRGRVRIHEIAQFTYQLRVLLEARIPIGDGLHGLAQQEDNPTFKQILTDIAARVEAGETIASAMRSHRKVFGDTYVETIHAAEQSGTMLRTLDHLSEAVERMEEGRRQTKGAVLYPACVLITLFTASGFLVTYTLPKFAAMYESRGLDLPIMTMLLAAIGGSVRGYWWAWLAGSVGGVFLARWVLTSRMQAVESVLHRVPAIKPVLVAVAMARFARVFTVSLSAGLGLIDALEMGSRAAGRRLLSNDLQDMADRVRTGQSLSDGLSRSTYIPTFAKRMMVAGEQSGELVRMAEIVAKHYERETSHRIKSLTTVLEPVLVVLIAVVVLSIALAIFLPMWNMIQLMG